MAKKSDILSLYKKDFPNFYTSYNTRLRDLEREFLDVKNFQHESLKESIAAYEKIETDLRGRFLTIEKNHHDNKLFIEDMYRDRFEFLGDEIEEHNQNASEQIENENKQFQDILNQFEERKSEAFDTYLRLSREANNAIEREHQIHHDFINGETDKLLKIKQNYENLNSDLSNQLLWTMEKAKNSLEKLNQSLKSKAGNDIDFMNDTIFESLGHLRQSHDKLSVLFSNTTHDLEKERDKIRNISINKRKPHSDLNQEMIQDFVSRIREVNQRRISFEQMISQELKVSLELLYPKIIQADAENKDDDLHKFILQKEIIEKKAKYLQERNQKISDLLISKYQNEIKKIKIDSFKRYEEIKLAYEMPASFFQNSVNLYSNFNFYLNEAFNDFDNILMDLIKYNQNYIEIKSNYITGSSKVVEDYKINLMVRVNDLTVKLSNYISNIDEISHAIVTLESSNRLEIAEIKKKMENVEIQGDLQKYLASLEDDQYLALFQHNKNIEKIQMEANYTQELLRINSEVLLLNKNKQDLDEFRQYLIEICGLENEIQNTTYKKRLAEAKVYYQQQKHMIDVTMRLAKARLSYNVKRKNYGYIIRYDQFLLENESKDKMGSNHIVEFVHQVQKMIDLNKSETLKINEFLSAADDNNAYITTLQENRDKILTEISRQTAKKTKVCRQAVELYDEENAKLLSKVLKVFHKYKLMLKQLILLNESDSEIDRDYVIKTNAFLAEILAAARYINTVTSDYAYKYQVPSVLKMLKKNFEKRIEKIVFLNLRQLEIITRSNNHNKIRNALIKYYIETLGIFEKLETLIDYTFIDMSETVTKTDRLFIERTEKHDKNTKNIIRLEYKKLLKKAFKHKVNKENQINQFKNEANTLNDIFKNQVQKINREFLTNRNKTDKFSDYLKKEFIKAIIKNDKELISLLKFIDKIYINDLISLDRQYKEYLKTFEKIDFNQKNDYQDEVDYVNHLYDSRVAETQKTIGILEQRINELPIKKQETLSVILRDRQTLIDQKRKELMKKYTEIEKEKFLSRPQYLKQITAIQKRLPEDYLELYKKIQSLQDDFIKQYVNINSDYENNYQNFLESQKQYKDAVTKHALIYKPFEDIKKYNDTILTQTDVLYKDTLAKSKDTRDTINQTKQKSKEKQKRIINA